jgi:hypothetical protein
MAREEQKQQGDGIEYTPAGLQMHVHEYAVPGSRDRVLVIRAGR